MFPDSVAKDSLVFARLLKKSYCLVVCCVDAGAVSSSGADMRGYVSIGAASLLWGTMGILAKFAYGYGIRPELLIAMRLSVGFVTISVVLLLFSRGSLKVRRSDAFFLIVFGVFGVACQRLSYFYAVNLTTATVAAILFYTYPVFLSIYALFAFRERIGSGEVLAIVLTFLGVAFVVRVYDVASLRVSFVGILFGLASSLLFVVYFVLTKRFRPRYESWTLTFIGEGVGTIVMMPVVAVSLSEIAAFPAELWVLILAIAWFPSLLAYVLYSYAVRYVKASKGSILSVIEPLSAAVFSTIFIGERLEALQILGIAIALTGVILLFRKNKA